MSAAQAEGAAGADGAACARGHGRPPPRPHGEGPERQLSGAMGPSPAPRHEPPASCLLLGSPALPKVTRALPAHLFPGEGSWWGVLPASRPHPSGRDRPEPAALPRRALEARGCLLTVIDGLPIGVE